MTSDQERLIAEFVEKGLAGDMDSINAIEDRALRGKVKSALVKAKRSGAVAKESKEDTKIPEKENQKKWRYKYNKKHDSGTVPRYFN